MHHPAHLDGCNIVVIRQRSSWLGGFDVIESGWLNYDGETLTLESDQTTNQRTFTEAEQQQILTVSPATQIPECMGYQLYVLQPPA